MQTAFRHCIPVVALLAAAGSVARANGVQKASLPLVVYSEAGRDVPFIPSGYMGNNGAIKMDDSCKDDPHAGKMCLKVQYTAEGNWGGVVWQSPPNDWGDQPGGWDIRGAKKLVFWARGAQGGEAVSFSFGLLKDKPYSDSGSGKLDKVALTREWKKYAIDLTGTDLSHVKTGFCWVVAGSGKPVTFYLDDIEYE